MYSNWSRRCLPTNCHSLLPEILHYRLLSMVLCLVSSYHTSRVLPLSFISTVNLVSPPLRHSIVRHYSRWRNLSRSSLPSSSISPIQMRYSSIRSLHNALHTPVSATFALTARDVFWSQIPNHLPTHNNLSFIVSRQRQTNLDVTQRHAVPITSCLLRVPVCGMEESKVNFVNGNLQWTCSGPLFNTHSLLPDPIYTAGPISDQSTPIGHFFPFQHETFRSFVPKWLHIYLGFQLLSRWCGTRRIISISLAHSYIYHAPLSLCYAIAIAFTFFFPVRIKIDLQEIWRIFTRWQLESQPISRTIHP